jgi:hypothetical protein
MRRVVGRTFVVLFARSHHVGEPAASSVVPRIQNRVTLADRGRPMSPARQVGLTGIVTIGLYAGRDQ